MDGYIPPHGDWWRQGPASSAGNCLKCCYLRQGQPHSLLQKRRDSYWHIPCHLGCKFWAQLLVPVMTSITNSLTTEPRGNVAGKEIVRALSQPHIKSACPSPGLDTYTIYFLLLWFVLLPFDVKVLYFCHTIKTICRLGFLGASRCLKTPQTRCPTKVSAAVVGTNRFSP